jgi:DNA-binding NarL/FixJ family response regulator
MRGKGRPGIYCSALCHNRGNGARRQADNSYVDEMAVVRLVDGWGVDATRGERVEAVAILTRRGRSASWIAESLHITERTICRYRAELHRREVAA